LRNLIYYLECGKVQQHIYIYKNKQKQMLNNTEFFEFRVENFEDINKKKTQKLFHSLLINYTIAEKIS
jgi:hypothetical protein